MTPGAIQEYSDRIKQRLRGSSYRPVPHDPRGIDMYVPSEIRGDNVRADAPFTFCSALAWSPEMKEQRGAWESLAKTAHTSWAITYPDANAVHVDVGDVARGAVFPLIASQMYAKYRRSIRGNLCLVDLDVLAYRPADMFAVDFEVGLTDCDDLWPGQPFNAGVQFYKDTPGAQKFCDTVAEITWAIPGNMDPWYSYQLATRVAYDMLKHEVNFVIFPHDRYNFTPTDGFVETDAYFVHSRGDRKNMQFDYYKRLVERTQEGAK